MNDSTIICSIDFSHIITRAPFFWQVVLERCVSSSTSLRLCTVVLLFDTDSTIICQDQALTLRYYLGLAACWNAPTNSLDQAFVLSLKQ